MHRPGFEPGYSAWKADIIAARPSVHTGEVYMHLQSINIFGHSNIDNMTGASQVKEEIRGIAAKYGIEVVGWLKLGDGIAIPGDEMGLLKGVKWANGEVDVSNVKNPRDIMPSAKAMIILGKRLMDDRCDIYYRVSDSYMASVEMMLLDIASLRTVECLRKNGFQGEEYTSYYLKAWAVLAGLGWIGKSMMFVSKEHGPRLRLKGVLTDADLGVECEVLGDDSCGSCEECIKACPVGAISAEDVDRKKCASCGLNHLKLRENAYAYCIACTACCPVGRSAPASMGMVPNQYLGN